MTAYILRKESPMIRHVMRVPATELIFASCWASVITWSAPRLKSDLRSQPKCSMKLQNVKATHDSRTNRHYPRTVLYRPITKQPQATCISCYTPTNLVAISWAWHRDWTSVSWCLFEKRYIYPTSIDAIPQNRLLSLGFFNLQTCSAS